jgi:hypothetical protein
MAKTTLAELEEDLLFFLFRRLVGLVTPGVRLRTGNDAGDVRIFFWGTPVGPATAGARFSTTCGLFLLLFCTSALAFAFSPRQRIPSSHLPLL